MRPRFPVLSLISDILASGPGARRNACAGTLLERQKSSWLARHPALPFRWSNSRRFRKRQCWGQSTIRIFSILRRTPALPCPKQCWYSSRETKNFLVCSTPSIAFRVGHQPKVPVLDCPQHCLAQSHAGFGVRLSRREHYWLDRHPEFPFPKQCWCSSQETKIFLASPPPSIALPKAILAFVSIGKNIVRWAATQHCLGQEALLAFFPREKKSSVLDVSHHYLAQSNAGVHAWDRSMFGCWTV